MCIIFDGKRKPMKNILLVFVFIVSYLNAQGQCASFPYISNKKGNINAGLSVVNNGLFCYKSSINFDIITDSNISVDSICIIFGDGDTTIIKPTWKFTISHQYNFTPKDSCPMVRPQKITVLAKYYLGDPASGQFSYNEISTPVSIQYLPRLPKLKLGNDTICVNDNLSIITSGNCCTNGFYGSPSVYTWYFGDGSAPQTVSDTTNNYTIPAPPHKYSKAGIYWVRLECTNNCGTITDSIPIVVAAIDSVQIPRGGCSGSSITPIIYATNAVYYNTTCAGNVTITGQNTKTPKITFNSAGKYTIYFSIGLNSICQLDTDITIAQGPNMALNKLQNICYTGNDSFVFANYFSTSDTAQKNVFYIYYNGSLLKTITQKGIPKALSLTQTGKYLILDSSFNSCGGMAVIDSFIYSPATVLNSVTGFPASVCVNKSVTPCIHAVNATSYNISISPVNGGYNITNQNDSCPTITFTIAGNYKITFNANGCCSSNACSTSQNITVKPNADMQMTTAFSDTCYTASYFIDYSLHFSTSGASQSNHFYILKDGSIVNQQTTSSIASAVNISGLAPAGNKITVIDSSFSACDTIILVDSFNILPKTVIKLPADYDTCVQTMINLPTNLGTTITLNGGIVQPGNYYLNALGLYQFIYTPVCGTPATLSVTAKGVIAKGHDSAFCLNPGMVKLLADPPGCKFSGNFVSNDSFDGTASGSGTFPFYATYIDTTSQCTYIDTAYITVNTQLQTSYTLSKFVCDGVAATFTNNNINLIDSVYFGDSTAVVSGNNLSHTYNSIGMKVVGILFKDNFGCKSFAQDTIIVLPLPVSNFTVNDTVCGGDSVSPIITSAIDTFNIYEWYVDGILISNPQSILCVNNTTSIITLQISLKVISPSCGSITKTRDVTILPQMIVDFGLIYNKDCSPMPLAFNNLSTVFNPHYSWYINDVLFSTDSLPPSMILTANATDSVYYFKLIICTDCACDTIIRSVLVHPVNFIACFIPSQFTACANQDITFTDCVVSGTMLTYKYGDGDYDTTRNGRPVTHHFKNAGTYSVWLIANNNCHIDSTVRTITILPSPEVITSIPNSNCSEYVLNFLSTITQGNPAAYHWSFGDSTVDTLSQNPTHIYNKGGTYNGSLVVIDVNGCPSDTAVFSVEVDQTPHVSFSYPDTVICSGKPLKIMVQQPAANTTYVWKQIYNTDTVLITTYNGIYNFKTFKTGLYYIVLQATSNDLPFCSKTSDTLKIQVNISPAAHFKPNPPYTIIDSPFILFENESRFSISYLWNFGDNDISYEDSPTHEYKQTGLFWVTLVAINGQCTDTVQQSIYIDPVFVFYMPNAFTPNDDGHNDNFFGNGQGYDSLDMIVYNRWGERLYYELNSKTIFIGWDGNCGICSNQKTAQEDVYIYVVKVKAWDRRLHQYMWDDKEFVTQNLPNLKRTYKYTGPFHLIR